MAFGHINLDSLNETLHRSLIKSPVLVKTCATCSESHSTISTMVGTSLLRNKFQGQEMKIEQIYRPSLSLACVIPSISPWI